MKKIESDESITFSLWGAPFWLIGFILGYCFWIARIGFLSARASLESKD